MLLKTNVKEAIYDILKEQVDRYNNGRPTRYKANPSSMYVINNYGIRIEDNIIYQRGKPIFTINYTLSKKQKNSKGQPKLLFPTLTAIGTT